MARVHAKSVTSYCRAGHAAAPPRSPAQAGVMRALEIIEAEINNAMCLVGLTKMSELTREFVGHPRPGPRAL